MSDNQEMPPRYEEVFHEDDARISVPAPEQMEVEGTASENVDRLDNQPISMFDLEENVLVIAEDEAEDFQDPQDLSEEAFIAESIMTDFTVGYHKFSEPLNPRPFSNTHNNNAGGRVIEQIMIGHMPEMTIIIRETEKSDLIELEDFALRNFTNCEIKGFYFICPYNDDEKNPHRSLNALLADGAAQNLFQILKSGDAVINTIILNLPFDTQGITKALGLPIKALHYQLTSAIVERCCSRKFLKFLIRKNVLNEARESKLRPDATFSDIEGLTELFKMIKNGDVKINKDNARHPIHFDYFHIHDEYIIRDVLKLFFTHKTLDEAYEAVKNGKAFRGIIAQMGCINPSDGYLDTPEYKGQLSVQEIHERYPPSFMDIIFKQEKPEFEDNPDLLFQKFHVAFHYLPNDPDIFHYYSGSMHRIDVYIF